MRGTSTKLNFGQRMWLLKQQRAKAAKDKALIDQFPPVAPINMPVPTTYIYKPVELKVTAPTVPDFPGTVIEQHVQAVMMSPFDKAIQHLREQANKI